MQRNIDVVQCRFGYNGAKYQHPRLSGSDTIDAFITFIRIKHANGLQSLPDYNIDNVLAAIKRVGQAFSGPLYPQDQFDLAKSRWSEMMLNDRANLTGFTQEFVWSKILNESKIIYYFRCPKPDCMHHLDPEVLPDLSSISAMYDLGFSRAFGHRVTYVTGDLEADLVQYRVTCPSCQTPHLETWPMLPASTWLLRYYRKRDNESNFAPSDLRPSINTSRGIFTLSYVEFVMVVRPPGDDQALERQYGAIFHVSNRYFVYDSRVEQGSFMSLDLGFDWEQVMAYLIVERDIVTIEWNSALYSKVIELGGGAVSDPPSSDESATTTSSHGPPSPEIPDPFEPGLRLLPITHYHAPVRMGTPEPPSTESSSGEDE